MNDLGTAFALIGGVLTAVTLLLFVLTKLESSLEHAQRPKPRPAVGWRPPPKTKQ